MFLEVNHAEMDFVEDSVGVDFFFKYWAKPVTRSGGNAKASDLQWVPIFL